MAYSYEELRKKTIDELREIAKGVEHDAVKGYTQMNKDHLLPALCKALGIEGHGHHEVIGIDKGKIKAKIKELKGARDKELEAQDNAQLKQIRRKMNNMTRSVRTTTG